MRIWTSASMAGDSVPSFDTHVNYRDMVWIDETNRLPPYGIDGVSTQEASASNSPALGFVSITYDA
jgi:hypothetical protein